MRWRSCKLAIVIAVLAALLLTAGCGSKINYATVVMEDELLPLQHVTVVTNNATTVSDRHGRFAFRGRRVNTKATALYGASLQTMLTANKVVNLAKPVDWGKQYMDDLIGFTFVYADENRQLLERPYMTARWPGPEVKVRLAIPAKYHDWYKREVIGYWQDLLEPYLRITVNEEKDANILVEHVYDPESLYYGVWKWSVKVDGYLQKGTIQINLAKTDIDPTTHLGLNRHEFGHALGLVHSREEGSLMHPFLAKQYREVLAPHEEHALKVLYSIPADIAKPGIDAQSIIVDRIID